MIIRKLIIYSYIEKQYDLENDYRIKAHDKKSMKELDEFINDFYIKNP